jgi:hypothetical protein
VKSAEGCVYPAAVPTLGNQLSAAGLSWAAYLQDMGSNPARITRSGKNGPGGGRVGAVVLSRSSGLAPPATTTARLLRTVEDIFGLP